MPPAGGHGTPRHERQEERALRRRERREHVEEGRAHAVLVGIPATETHALDEQLGYERLQPLHPPAAASTAARRRAGRAA